MFNTQISANKIVAVFVVAAVVVLMMMLALFFHGNRLVSEHSPLIDAVVGIKLEATQGHLWFEEINSGDQSESIETVWQHLDKADRFALAMLEGGIIGTKRVRPLKIHRERQLIFQVRYSLTSFRDIAEGRYRSSSEPGSTLDIEFDQVFRRLINDAANVEHALKMRIDSEVVRFKFWFIAAFLTSTVLLASVIYLLHRVNQKNAELVQSLKETNKEIENKNRALDHKAHFDALTELPNRALFNERLQQYIAEAAQTAGNFALLFVDLDRFKVVNDQHGHLSGDRVLAIVAKRLTSTICDNDFVTRVSGDEFVLLLRNVLEPRAIDTIASRIIQSLSQPIELNGATVTVTASIGIAVYPKDSVDKEELINFADSAMYMAKQGGKNRYCYHSASIRESMRLQRKLEGDLRYAVKNEELVVYFQPQINVDSSKLHGLEALVRWNHPTMGLLSPSVFIPVAEQIGMVNDIDHFVFKQTISQLKHWQENGIDVPKISSNFSAVSFDNDDFISRIMAVLANSDIEYDKIELEFTESALIKDIKHTKSTLKRLRKVGIKVAIDDFGTGYSSMSSLKDLPVDTLKIDKTFVSDLATHPKAPLVLEHIVALAKSLGLSIVAEGIETEQQLYQVYKLGVEIGQGYFYSKPRSVVEIEPFLISLTNDNIHCIIR